MMLDLARRRAARARQPTVIAFLAAESEPAARRQAVSRQAPPRCRRAVQRTIIPWLASAPTTRAATICTQQQKQYVRRCFFLCLQKIDR